MASKFEFQVQILPLQVEPETASFCHTTNESFVMFLRPKRLKWFKMQIEGKTKASCFMLISPSLVLSPNHNAVMCGSSIWSLNQDVVRLFFGRACFLNLWKVSFFCGCACMWCAYYHRLGGWFQRRRAGGAKLHGDQPRSPGPDRRCQLQRRQPLRRPRRRQEEWAQQCGLGLPAGRTLFSRKNFSLKLKNGLSFGLRFPTLRKMSTVRVDSLPHRKWK